MSAEPDSDTPKLPGRPRKASKAKPGKRKRKAQKSRGRQARKAARAAASSRVHGPEEPTAEKALPQQELQRSEPLAAPRELGPQQEEARQDESHEPRVSGGEHGLDREAPSADSTLVFADDQMVDSVFAEAPEIPASFPLPLPVRKRRSKFRHFRNIKTIVVAGVIGIVAAAALAGAFVIFGLPMLRARTLARLAPEQPRPGDAPVPQKTGTPGWFPRRSPVVRLRIPESEQPAHSLLFAVATPPKIEQLPLDLASRDAKEAIRLMERYRRCTEWPDKMPLILRHDRSEEALRAFYDQRKEHDPQIDLDAVGAFVMAIGDARIVMIVFPSRDRADEMVMAYFHRTVGGHLRLDWESFVGASDMGWLEFRRERIYEPVFLRGYATLDDYYNYEFADPARFLSVKLRSPDGTVIVNAFCSRGSQAARFLLEALIGVPDRRILAPPLAPPLRPIENLPVAVTVRFPPGAQSNHCVELLEMVAGRWFLCDNETALAAAQANATGIQLIDNLRKSVMDPTARQ